MKKKYAVSSNRKPLVEREAKKTALMGLIGTMRAEKGRAFQAPASPYSNKKVDSEEFDESSVIEAMGHEDEDEESKKKKGY